MLGTIQSALVLGDARDTHLRNYHSSASEFRGVCDGRFVDDGQVFVGSWAFDWCALDAALASFGATRNCVAHGNVKLSAGLLCLTERTRMRVAGMGHSVRS